MEENTEMQRTIVETLSDEYKTDPHKVVQEVCYDRVLCKALNVDYCDPKIYSKIENILR